LCERGEGGGTESGAPRGDPHRPTLLPPRTAGVIDCVKKTLAWEGVGGLYKGVASPLAGQMVFRATLFGAFGESKRYLSRGGTRPLTDAQYFQAGAATGFVAAFAEAPIDFYKSQIQVQTVRARSDPKYVAPYSNVVDCVKATLKTSGVRGPFQVGHVGRRGQGFGGPQPPPARAHTPSLSSRRAWASPCCATRPPTRSTWGPSR